LRHRADGGTNCFLRLAAQSGFIQHPIQEAFSPLSNRHVRGIADRAAQRRGTPTRLIVKYSLSSIRRQNISLNDRRGGGVGGVVVRIRLIRSSGVSGPKGTTALAASSGAESDNERPAIKVTPTPFLAFPHVKSRLATFSGYPLITH
jgi:hypothetical protein